MVETKAVGSLGWWLPRHPQQKQNIQALLSSGRTKKQEEWLSSAAWVEAISFELFVRFFIS